jgi:hypothetical protein
VPVQHFHAFNYPQNNLFFICLEYAASFSRNSLLDNTIGPNRLYSFPKTNTLPNYAQAYFEKQKILTTAVLLLSGCKSSPHHATLLFL